LEFKNTLIIFPGCLKDKDRFFSIDINSLLKRGGSDPKDRKDEKEDNANEDKIKKDPEENFFIGYRFSHNQSYLSIYEFNSQYTFPFYLACSCNWSRRVLMKYHERERTAMRRKIAMTEP
jgi:hypothetical protein